MSTAFDPPPTSPSVEGAEGSDTAAAVVSENPTLTRIGRAGWFAKGSVYLLAGLLALLVALRSLGWAEENRSDEASPTGAIKEVSQHVFGGPLLIVLAAGLAVYAGWRLVSAVLPGPSDVKARATRIGYVVSAVIYCSFAFTAAKLVVRSPQETDGDGTVTAIVDAAMGYPGGRWAVGVVGSVIIGVGLYRAEKGRTQDVTNEMSLAGMSPRRRVWVHRLGAAGEVGRGLALGLIGYFLLTSAITFEPEQATGLDGALRRAASHGFTRALVPLVALGFVSYGVFCLATFTRRRFEAPG